MGYFCSVNRCPPLMRMTAGRARPGTAINKNNINMMRRKHFILFFLMTLLCSTAAWADEEGGDGIGQGDGSLEHPYTGVWDIMVMSDRLKVGDYLDQNCEFKQVIRSLNGHGIGESFALSDEHSLRDYGRVRTVECKVGSLLDDENNDWYCGGFYHEYISCNPLPDRKSHLFLVTRLKVSQRTFEDGWESYKLEIVGRFTGIYKIPNGSTREEEFVKLLTSLKNKCPQKFMTESLESDFAQLEGMVRRNYEDNEHVTYDMEYATTILRNHLVSCYKDAYDNAAKGIEHKYVTDILAECKNDIDVFLPTNRNVGDLVELGERNLPKISAAADFYRQGVADGLSPKYKPTLPGSRMVVTLKDGKVYEFNVRDLKEDVEYIEVKE